MDLTSKIYYAILFHDFLAMAKIELRNQFPGVGINPSLVRSLPRMLAQMRAICHSGGVNQLLPRVSECPNEPEERRSGAHIVRLSRFRSEEGNYPNLAHSQNEEKERREGDTSVQSCVKKHFCQVLRITI